MGYRVLCSTDPIGDSSPEHSAASPDEQKGHDGLAHPLTQVLGLAVAGRVLCHVAEYDGVANRGIKVSHRGSRCRGTSRLAAELNALNKTSCHLSLFCRARAKVD